MEGRSAFLLGGEHVAHDSSHHTKEGYLEETTNFKERTPSFIHVCICDGSEYTGIYINTASEQVNASV